MATAFNASLGNDFFDADISLPGVCPQVTAELPEGDEPVKAQPPRKEVFVKIIADLVALVWFIADQDLSLDFNTGAGVEFFIEMEAGVPLVWHKGCKHANPILHDVGTLHVTNRTGKDGVLKMRVLEDSTP